MLSYTKRCVGKYDEEFVFGLKTVGTIYWNILSQDGWFAKRIVDDDFGFVILQIQ